MLQYVLKRLSLQTFNAILLVFTLVTATHLSAAFAADFSDLTAGQAAFNRHQYDKAFSIWMSLAQQGNSDAQVFVGLAYQNGWGVSKDLQRSNMWFQMAAESENPAGQFFLGLHYVSSKDPKTVSTGVQWLVQAAENGDTSAKQFLIKARIRRWFDVPSTLNMKPIVNEATKVTPDNFEHVFPSETTSSTSQQSSTVSQSPLVTAEETQARVN